MEITNDKGANALRFSNLRASGEQAKDFDDILMVSDKQSDFMYYLQLQIEVMKITTQYQALSNIMKARFDSVMNAIRNIR